MSLTEHIDRVARNARSIADVASAAAHSTSGANPFTRAMLKTDLGDLIRDIDPAELGLFNLLPPSKPAAAMTTTTEANEAFSPRITRAEFIGATPLRRQLAQRPEARSKESEPEAYAHAALQCIVRYQSIRPMTRAYNELTQTLEDLRVARQNIHQLNQLLQQSQEAEAPSLKGALDEKEVRITALQARVQELQRRKAVVSQKSPSQDIKQSKPSQASVTPPRSGAARPEQQPWSTPAASARTFQLDESLLMDEVMDVGNMSLISLSADDTSILDDGISVNSSLDKTVKPEEVMKAADSRLDLKEDSMNELSPEELPRALTAPELPDEDTDWEKERIVNKIWLSVADLLFPDTADRPPTMEVLSNLHAIAEAPIQAEPPSGPFTSQQIFMASLLHLLLSAAPTFSLPLNDLKARLAEKAGISADGSLMAAQPTTRVIYGCVAKRLLKINRGGGEQIVAFDV